MVPQVKLEAKIMHQFMLQYVSVEDSVTQKALCSLGSHQKLTLIDCIEVILLTIRAIKKKNLL